MQSLHQFDPIEWEHIVTTAKIAALLLFVSCLNVGVAFGQPFNLVQPYIPEPGISGEVREPSEEVYINRTGEVILDVGGLVALQSQTSSTGRSGAPQQINDLILGFFPEQSFRVTVYSTTQSSTGVLSITGKLAGSELQTFTLSMDEDGYVINLQDMTGGMIYKAFGNSQTGIGSVTEIDPGKMPPVYDLDPVVPEQ